MLAKLRALMAPASYLNASPLRSSQGTTGLVPSAPFAAAAIIVATAIWGYGFVATAEALRLFAPLWLTGLRFLVSLIVSLPFLLWWAKPGVLSFAQMRLAIAPAAVIAAMMALQTWSLTRTSIANSGFITTLYVIFVPLFEVLLFGKRIGFWHAGCVALALVGTALMCGWQAGEINMGDVATLMASLLAAAHILLIERVAGRVRSVFAFNTMQAAFASFFTLPLAFLYEPLPILAWDRGAIFGFVWLVIGSTIIAFALQVVAQRRLSPSIASLLFLLESPFAAACAFFFLGDVMSAMQLWGAGLILAASALALSRPQTK